MAGIPYPVERCRTLCVAADDGPDDVEVVVCVLDEAPHEALPYLVLGDVGVSFQEVW